MLRQIVYKYLFLLPVMTGFLIQTMKVVLYSIVDRKVNLVRFIQTDGMPNLHAAVFSSLSTGVGLKYGVRSILFSFVTAYSVIIIHDTMRLKGEKGKQGNVLNKIIASLGVPGDNGETGAIHVLQFRPLDVMSGAILGILSAFLLM